MIIKHPKQDDYSVFESEVEGHVKELLYLMNSDDEPEIIAPMIRTAYSKLDMDKQIEVNHQLKTFSIESANNRQGNTVLRSFINYKSGDKSRCLD